jgi:hypothetical protein
VTLGKTSAPSSGSGFWESFLDFLLVSSLYNFGAILLIGVLLV